MYQVSSGQQQMATSLYAKPAGALSWHITVPHRAFPEVVEVCVQAYVPLLSRLERFLALPQLHREAGHLRFQRLPCLLCCFRPLQGFMFGTTPIAWLQELVPEYKQSPTLGSTEIFAESDWMSSPQQALLSKLFQPEGDGR